VAQEKIQPPQTSTTRPKTPVDEFLDHLVGCGHCQSFPRSLCETGQALQRRAAQTFTKIALPRRQRPAREDTPVTAEGSRNLIP
jgi:hypothetical protein